MPDEAPTLRVWYQDYRRREMAWRASTATITAFDRAVDYFEAFAGGGVKVDAISEAQLSEFIAERQAGPKGEQTPKYRRELARCVRRIVRDWNPALPIPSEDAKSPEPSPEASQTLQGYFDEVYFPTVMFNVSAGYQTYSRTILRRFHQFHGRQILLSELEDAHLAHYLRSRLEEGRPASTVNGERRVICAIWRHADRAGLTAKPPRVKKLKEDRDEPEAWTAEEFARIVQAAGQLDGGRAYGNVPRHLWWTAVLTCAYWSALRIGSILKIRTTDIDLRSGWLTVPAGNTKTKRAKRCRLGASALEPIGRIITEYRSPGELVFVPQPCSSAITKTFIEILEAAGVPYVRRKSRFHRIRRTAATIAFQNGGIAAASALLDHSDPKVTYEHYIDGRAIRDNDATMILPFPTLPS
jgi:integrase